MKNKGHVKPRIEGKEKELYSPIYPVEFPFIEKYSRQSEGIEYKDNLTKADEKLYKPGPFLDPEVLTI